MQSRLLIALAAGVIRVRSFSFINNQITSIFARDLDISSEFNIPILQSNNDNGNDKMLIIERDYSNDRLQLLYIDNTSKDKENPFYIDFLDGDIKYRSSATHLNNELVVKACGGIKAIKNNNCIWDLTAGLGRDSFILASAGFNVMLFEKNLIIHGLLKDAIRRLESNENNIVSERLKLYDTINSCDILNNINMDLKPDIIYLDPMYESGDVGKKSKVKKETQILHRILGKEENSIDHESNNKQLLDTARNLAKSKIVVKRPYNAKYLAQSKPHNSITAGKTRFDIYYQNQM